MKLTADEYFQASQDHIEETWLLLEERRYAFSHFTAGLAVECMFRAYAVRNGAAFDGKHDLRKWFALARFDEVTNPAHSERIAAAYDVVALQWNSTQRYYSEGFLRAHFHNNRFDRGIKGNIAKELTRRLVEAAFEVVTEGKLRWMSK
jgi:hypothetical protein